MAKWPNILHQNAQKCVCTVVYFTTKNNKILKIKNNSVYLKIEYIPTSNANQIHPINGDFRNEIFCIIEEQDKLGTRSTKDSIKYIHSKIVTLQNSAEQQ